MNKIKTVLGKIKSWSLRKKIFYGVLVAICLLIILQATNPSRRNGDIVTDVVKRANLIQSILASGQVVSNTDLSLSFDSTGVVKSIRVSVGSKVYAGQVLATLDQSSALAEVTKARGALQAAEAKYQQVIKGYSDSEISLARVLLENAKNEYNKTVAEQDALVKKAFNEYWVNETMENYDAHIAAQKAKDSAVTAAQALINQRQSELDLKLAQAETADINLAKADIVSAEGQLQFANANLEDTVLRAPANGTVTKVDIKLGELGEALKEAIVIQDVENLYIEAKINEANIALARVGHPVSITYDSLGPNKVFNGTVSSIDPSSTTEDGVVNYKIKVALSEKDEVIRPGMNANINITTLSKDNVLIVPLLAIKNIDGKSFLKVVNDSKRKTYDEVEVEIGATGDGNLVEIVSGAEENTPIVVIDKK